VLLLLLLLLLPLLLCLLRKLGTRLWDWLSIENQQLCGNFKLSLGGTLGTPLLPCRVHACCLELQVMAARATLLACSLHACCLKLQRKAAYVQLLAARTSLLMHSGLSTSSVVKLSDMRLSAA